MFTTIQHTRGSTGTFASIPSSGAGDVGKQGGDGKQSAEGKRKQVEEEPFDYEPSPVREKDKEKTPPQDDDVYSLSKLSAPRQGHQKV
jgi:hypothetical protein